MKLTPSQRRFHLDRKQDVSGVSGTGERVAEGCVFSNGAVVLEWLSACASTNRYGNVQAMLQVHGHAGATRIVWDDPDALVLPTQPEHERLLAGLLEIAGECVQHNARGEHWDPRGCPGCCALEALGVKSLDEFAQDEETK